MTRSMRLNAVLATSAISCLCAVWVSMAQNENAEIAVEELQVEAALIGDLPAVELPEAPLPEPELPVEAVPAMDPVEDIPLPEVVEPVVEEPLPVAEPIAEETPLPEAVEEEKGLAAEVNETREALNGLDPETVIPDVPVDEAPTAEVPAEVVEEPVAEIPVVETPLVEDAPEAAAVVPEAPAVDAPVEIVEEPLAEGVEETPAVVAVPEVPVVEVPAAEVPAEVVEEPVAEIPVDEVPLVEEATAVAAVPEEPAIDVPVEVVEEPGVEEPLAEGVEEPVVEEPLAEDTTGEAVVVPDEPVVEEVEDVPEAKVAVDGETPDEFEPTLDAQDDQAAVDMAPDPVEHGDDLDLLMNQAIETAVSAGVEEPPEGLTVPPGLDPEQNAAISIMSDSEILKRQAYEQHGRDSLKSGDEAMGNKDFLKAMTFYREAMTYLGRRPDTKGPYNTARKGLAEASYRQALLLRAKGEYDGALDMARNANTFGHPAAAKLSEQLKQDKVKPPVPEVKLGAVVPRRTQEDYQTSRADIQNRMRRGREYFQAREYQKAKDEFESVLKRDATNTEAIRMLEKIGRVTYDRSTEELEATRRNMIGDVRDTWNPRGYAVGEEFRPDTKKEPDGRSKPIQRLVEKMETITIPEIDFRQANINDVVEFLNLASVEFDTVSKDDEVKGVNIILNLQAGGAKPAAAAPSTDLFGDSGFGGGGGAATGGADVPLITFQARYVSVLQTLKIVTSVAGLQHSIEGNVVMILPKDAPTREIIHQFYDVESSFGNKVTMAAEELGRGGATGGGGGFLDGDAAGGVGGGAGGDSEVWKNFFAEMGVKWPIGSSIRHIPSIGKLVVANTSDNLALFEKILATLNVVPNQIEIEARFVEVQQKDLEALGFEWLLTDDWEVMQQQGSGALPLSMRPRVRVPANASSGGFTAGNRFTAGLENGPVASQVLRIGSVLTNPEVSMILHMLSQKGNNDLLSAPKVVTQSGAEATIKVVTEYIYPTDFSVEPVTGTDENGNSIVIGGLVEPSSFETREVGVILTVIPEVSPEGQMITLAMSPEVVSEPTWENYGSEFTSGDSSVVLNMRQPFFHTRRVNTTISIYNGATVMMGGMITEKRTSVDDKIPVLGDIPFIGRLFRSKYDQSDKRNLLIFVTARLVDPAGRHVQRQQGDISSLLQAPEMVETP